MRPAPRFWKDRELAEWATPIAALDVRRSHFSEREYYASVDAFEVLDERLLSIRLISNVDTDELHLQMLQSGLLAADEALKEDAETAVLAPPSIRRRQAHSPH